MSLKDNAQNIANIYQGMSGSLNVNYHLLDIYEGNLLPYVKEDLKCQLSANAYNIAEKRIPPINLMKRMIDKLSTIYNQPPKREVSGTEEDANIWDWYIDLYNLNVSMQVANEYFNMHKGCAIEPFIDKEFKPRIRIIPRDRFFVISDDVNDPMRPTHFVKVMGRTYVTTTSGKGKTESELRVILYVYTDEEFLIIDERGEVRNDLMTKYGLDGSNPYGKIPFVYMNRSMTKVNPQEDLDLLAMTKLIPILITDINYAMMFQSFSLIWTLDVEDENIKANPNSVISLKSDPKSPHKPEIGSIKPEIDSDKAFASIQEQLALWLQSRNIRPGATGQVSSDNMASGISKMVDEMDTTNERRKTIPFFQSAEYDLFNLIKNHMHPVYISNPSFGQKTVFTNDATLSVTFQEQAVQQTRMEQLSEVDIEIKNRLISQESAIRRINPDWNDEQVASEIKKINSQMEVEIEENVEAEETSGEEKSD